MSASDLATLVKQAVDIVDVVGQVVALRRSGHRHVGLCPFHHEKTASFQVDAENQLYYCFGCGAGGDVLSFVMKHQSASFAEAVRYLSERYHIDLPEREESSGLAEKARREREQLYQVLQVAADYFYDQLHHSRIGKGAREYISRRSLPAPVVETERLGYALAHWDGLIRHLVSRGVDLELAAKAGLVVESAKSRDGWYDRFRNRLMFPICDERGRIVAFGGRSLPGDGGVAEEPKYLNSPETPVYHKGRMLYQLARAREACRQSRQVVLVEGYMDLLAFHARGFTRVAATLGTALTAHQTRLLSRIADEVVFAYDGDTAGERAMLRALPIFLKEELSVSCLIFPGGMDPDDFLKAEGLGGFEALLAKREDLGLYALRKSLEGWDGSTAGKTRVLAELQPLFEAVRQPVLRAEYVRTVAERLALSERVIESQLHHDRRSSGKYSAPSASVIPSRVPQAQSLEESILRGVMATPALISELKASGASHSFEEPKLKAIAEILMQVPDPPENHYSTVAVYDQIADSECKELFARLAMESRQISGAQTQVKDWIQALRLRKSRQRLPDLKEALRQAEREGDKARVQLLLEQIQLLSSAKKRVKGTSENV